MAWVRVDDQFPDHPKVIAAGPMASWLYVCGVAYASRYLTDGFIPIRQIHKLADLDNANDLAEKLVEVGLWEPCDGGYRVHDYLDYNPPAEKVKAERAAAKDRMQRIRSGEVPANNERTEPEVREKFNDPVPHPRPVPTPVVNPKPQRKQRAREEDVEPERDELFEAVALACYGRWKKITSTERGRANEAVAELREAEYSPADVTEFARQYRARSPAFQLTPQTITKSISSVRATTENGANTDAEARKRRTDAEWEEFDRELAAAGVESPAPKPYGPAPGPHYLSPVPRTPSRGG